MHTKLWNVRRAFGPWEVIVGVSPFPPQKTPQRQKTSKYPPFKQPWVSEWLESSFTCHSFYIHNFKRLQVWDHDSSWTGTVPTWLWCSAIHPTEGCLGHVTWLMLYISLEHAPTALHCPYSLASHSRSIQLTLCLLLDCQCHLKAEQHSSTMRGTLSACTADKIYVCNLVRCARMVSMHEKTICKCVVSIEKDNLWPFLQAGRSLSKFFQLDIWVTYYSLSANAHLSFKHLYSSKQQQYRAVAT